MSSSERHAEVNRAYWTGLAPQYAEHAAQAIRLLRANGFEVLDLIELQAPADAEDAQVSYVGLEWGRRWPAEAIWKARTAG
jgi:hypothetical protein